MQCAHCKSSTAALPFSFLHRHKPCRGRRAVQLPTNGLPSSRGCKCEASSAEGVRDGQRAAAALCASLLLHTVQPITALAVDTSSMTAGTASRSATVEVVGGLVSENEANAVSTNTQVRRAGQ